MFSLIGYLNLGLDGVGYMMKSVNFFKSLSITALLMTGITSQVATAALNFGDNQLSTDKLGALINQLSKQAKPENLSQINNFGNSNSSFTGVVNQILPSFLNQKFSNIDSKYLGTLWNAEQNSLGKSQNILAQARDMALNKRTIIKGSCWDYINAVYNRAGVSMNERQTVHKGSYRGGPYAQPDSIQAGDWLYYINHSYKNIEHSGMFIGWVDKANKQALMLSYAGEGKREPARYKVYDLSNVYNIMRAA